MGVTRAGGMDVGAARRLSAARPVAAGRTGGAAAILRLSTFCGLTCGLLEVATRFGCRAIDPSRRLFQMTRHFVWMVPLADLLLFLVVGLMLAAVARIWARPVRWLAPRLLMALTILPSMMIAAPGLYAEALFLLALGIATLAAPPFLELDPGRRRRLLRVGIVAATAAVLLLGVSVPLGDWLKARREAARPRPADGSPNVLLIVLDTVRADHLSLYGYPRPTTPALERLAASGIRFDQARAPAPWTLASHASFLSGRWPHELGVHWATALNTRFPLLAEYLGSRGYATAGFVANMYCSYDTRMDRGFTHYEDYVAHGLAPLRTPILVEECLKAIFLVSIPSGPSGPLFGVSRALSEWFFEGHRKDAATINREFLDWLGRRAEPDRPFFVFLNFFDAHASYQLPAGAPVRFEPTPQAAEELWIVYDRWSELDKSIIPPLYLRLARNCYDNCLAHLDEQVDLLLAELRRRGVLDTTWVVITSDHGEGLGEHDLFDHGESLYSTETRVPLLILPPARSPARGVVGEPVSLRDLPATIVDRLGLADGSPFPGRSLARFWTNARTSADPGPSTPAFSELDAPNPVNPNHGRSPSHRGPLVSLVEGDYLYIRNERDGSEQLFDRRDDPRELTDRARGDAGRALLPRFRARIEAIKKETRGAGHR